MPLLGTTHRRPQVTHGPERYCPTDTKYFSVARDMDTLRNPRGCAPVQKLKQFARVLPSALTPHQSVLPVAFQSGTPSTLPLSASTPAPVLRLPPSCMRAGP